MADAGRRSLIRRLAPPGPPGHGRRPSAVWLAALPVALILGPMLPGLYWALAPALDLAREFAAAGVKAPWLAEVPANSAKS